MTTTRSGSQGTRVSGVQMGGNPSVPFGNLEEGGQNARLRMGVIVFGAATVLATVGIELAVPRALLALLFVPFFVGSFGMWAGLYSVCPSLALSNDRQLGGGLQHVFIPGEQRAARMLVLRAIVQSFAMALVATALVTWP